MLQHLVRYARGCLPDQGGWLLPYSLTIITQTVVLAAAPDRHPHAQDAGQVSIKEEVIMLAQLPATQRSL